MRRKHRKQENKIKKKKEIHDIQNHSQLRKKNNNEPTDINKKNKKQRS